MCLFHVKLKGSRTSKKRLMLDVSAARKKFPKKYVSKINLVRSVDYRFGFLSNSLLETAFRAVISSGKIKKNLVQKIIGTPRNYSTDLTMPTEIPFINVLYIRDNTSKEQAKGDHALTAIRSLPVRFWITFNQLSRIPQTNAKYGW